METTMTLRAQLHNDPQRALEPDAALAHETLSREVALVSRHASAHGRELGAAVIRSYGEALMLGSLSGASGFAWRRFVGAVWALVCELDRRGADRSMPSRAARGALDRIVVENVDLLV